MKDFSMYRYFKGEKESPFDKEKQNNEYMFWFYESIFERDYSGWDSSEWFNFFNNYGMGDAFMKILSEADYDKPTNEEKKQIFELWLKYLFSEKLYGEYGGDNWYKDAYYAAIAQ
jgi:hypothetical protein